MSEKQKRPKKPHLSVAVEPAQIKAWEKAAAREQRTLSSWVRYTLDQAAASK